MTTSGTRLVMLGTGTPNIETDRFGASLAVVVDGQAYLVDFGPGFIYRAAVAAEQGIAALAVNRLNIGFVTHLHSDHTAGLPSIMLCPWVLERRDPLCIFGPSGISAMTEHLLQAYQTDIQERLHGLEPANATGYQVIAKEIAPGLVYRDTRVTVEAFLVRHGIGQAFGYKFTTADSVIVVSGDTAPTEELITASQGCDILVHEVYATKHFAERPTIWQRYHSSMHSSSAEVAAIANAVRPGLLVLTHQLYWGASPEDLLAEVREDYDGPVCIAHDLAIYPPIEQANGANDTP